MNTIGGRDRSKATGKSSPIRGCRATALAAVALWQEPKSTSEASKRFIREVQLGGPKPNSHLKGGNLNIHKNMGSIDVNRVWSCLIQIASARTQPEPPWLQLNCECCFTPAPSEGADINVTPIKAIGNVHWILQMLSDLRWAVWMVNIT